MGDQNHPFLFFLYIFFKRILQFRCRDIKHLPWARPLIFRIVHVDLNQRTTKMLIDKLKTAINISISFLHCRKQHTNLKLKRYLFKIETKPILSKPDCSSKT